MLTYEHACFKKIQHSISDNCNTYVPTSKRKDEFLHISKEGNRAHESIRVETKSNREF